MDLIQEPPPIWQLKFGRTEKYASFMAFLIVGIMYGVYCLGDWSPWSIPIAFGAWLGISVAFILQWRMDRHDDYRMQQRKLEKNDVCPTCGGDGWVKK